VEQKVHKDWRKRLAHLCRRGNRESNEHFYAKKFFAENLHLIQPGLKLEGTERIIDKGKVDILATDQATGKFVAIEIVTASKNLPKHIFGYFINARMSLLKVIIVATSDLGRSFNSYRKSAKKRYEPDIELIDARSIMDWRDQEALVIHENIIKSTDKTRIGFLNLEKNLSLAKKLKDIRDKSFYKVFGYNSFAEYLASPEISMSEGQTSKLITNYEVWVEKYHVEYAQLNGIDFEKLYLASQVAGEENYEEWLDKARVLSRSELIIEIKEAKGH